jgi:hypothetical protein
MHSIVCAPQFHIHGSWVLSRIAEARCGWAKVSLFISRSSLMPNNVVQGSGIVHRKTLNAIRHLGPLRLVDLDYLSLKNQFDTEGKDDWFGKEGRLWLVCLPCK